MKISELQDADQLATKDFLRTELDRLRQFILEREVVATRWFIVLQVTYFFGTLAAVWFMLSQLLHK